MKGTATKADSVLHQLASYSKKTDQPLLREIRMSSLEALQETPFPSPRDEDWRFLNLKPISRSTFQPISSAVCRDI
ncbi:MAG: hypothetical protein WD355_08350, partial [Balneolaceae bacterium]